MTAVRKQLEAEITGYISQVNVLKQEKSSALNKKQALERENRDLANRIKQLEQSVRRTSQAITTLREVHFEGRDCLEAKALEHLYSLLNF